MNDKKGNKISNPPKSANDPCEKYGIALTNYVLDEDIGMAEADLFKHLSKCAKCQKELKQWRATHSLMRAQEYDSRPEVKQKNEAFIKELVNRPTPCVFSKDEKVFNLEIDTGKLSGFIWDYLARYGKTSDAELSKQLERDIPTIREAIGWLARENKIIKSERNGVTFVCLTETEMLKYKGQSNPDIRQGEQA